MGLAFGVGYISAGDLKLSERNIERQIRAYRDKQKRCHHNVLWKGGLGKMLEKRVERFKLRNQTRLPFNLQNGSIRRTHFTSTTEHLLIICYESSCRVPFEK